MSSDSPSNRRDWVSVAGIGSPTGSEERIKLRKILADAQIEYDCEGGVVYDILVSPENASRATEILKREQARGLKVFFLEDF